MCGFNSVYSDVSNCHWAAIPAV